MTRLLAYVDAWWTRPMHNAAGRAGLFRMVFALGYLWHVSLLDMSAIVDAPESTREALPFVELLPPNVSVNALQGLEMLLVAALVLLLFGLWVPLTTALILCVGVVREGYLSQFDIENGNLMFVFLIPLFALASASWGATYSLDAWRARERGATMAGASDNGWPFALIARSSLVLLAVLFPMAAALKLTGSGTWLESGTLLPHLMLERTVDASVLGLWPNPLAPWMLAHASWGRAMQIGVLLFELGFVFVLVGGTVRRTLLMVAMSFHVLSAWWLLVNFNGVLAAYASFVDWESGWQRVRSVCAMRRLLERASSLGAGAWTVMACIAALLMAGTWHRGSSVIMNLGGLVNGQTPWLVIGPLAIMALAWQQWRGAPSQL